VLLAASIDHRHFFGAQGLALDRDVDGGHAASDHDDPSANRQRGFVRRLPKCGDVVDRIHHPFDHLVLEPQGIDASKPESQEHRVVPLAQFGERNIFSETHASAHFDAADAEDVFHLARGEVIHGLVRRDAVLIEAA